MRHVWWVGRNERMSAPVNEIFFGYNLLTRHAKKRPDGYLHELCSLAHRKTTLGIYVDASKPEYRAMVQRYRLYCSRCGSKEHNVKDCPIELTPEEAAAESKRSGCCSGSANAG